ncbi:hypothetical protein [Vibrio crassostreae]|uniref:hypothetical protein n=1 Tax=Vibrio crassostreae TaxID=246167 RepID=UPI001B3108DA|nr:hypothetical protein [Vibrio crassostreae]
MKNYLIVVFNPESDSTTPTFFKSKVELESLSSEQLVRRLNDSEIFCISQGEVVSVFQSDKIEQLTDLDA